MHAHTTGVALALAILAMTSAQAKNIYVNNKGSCLLPATDCGGLFKPYKHLGDALSKTVAGDTVIITGNSDKPYHATIDGALTDVVGQDVMNFDRLSANPGAGQAVTTIKAAGSTKPIIRGSLKVGNWQLVSSTGGYLYKRSWLVRQWGATKTLEPQQVFRDTLPDGQRSLQQVGGQVFGGYHPSVDTSTIDPDLQAGLVGNPEGLWPGHRAFQGTDKLSNNQFWFDRANNELYVKLATALGASETLEVSVMQFIAQGTKVHNVVLQNLVFERSNTSTFWRGGAVQFTGSGNTLDRVDIRDADSGCAVISGDNSVVTASSFKRCGQVGLFANGNKLKITGNTFTGNNTRGFNPNWEAGPTKFIGGKALTGSEISGNVVAANAGHGIWLDTLNHDNLIQNNVVAFNLIGIYLENSDRGLINNNVVFGNRNQGVQLRGSPGTRITNNQFAGNGGDGVFMTAQSAVDPAHLNTGIQVTGNVFAWHDEASGNRKPVWVTPSTTLSNNRYCGRAASAGSLHFWLQDWTPDPLLGWPNNVFNWSSWRALKSSPNQSVAGHDTVGSVMQIAATLPPTVSDWTDPSKTPTLSQAGTTSNIATTRSNLLNLINQHCK